MKNIAIIGAGNVGSRHLQALKAVKVPLKIFVIEPNPNSLKLAKERYFSMPSDPNMHKIEYFQKITNFNEEIDIAIISTCSDIRKQIIEDLLESNIVKNLILEKILFQKPDDYYIVKDLFKKKKCKAWVNCSRRIIPTYKEDIKSWFYNEKFVFSVNGSNWGLMTNIIHYIDYMVFLLEDYDFTIDASYLNPLSIQSKREGFLELTGILQIHFKNGSHGIFQCFSKGQLPAMEEISSDTIRALIFPDELILKVWNQKKDLKWQESIIKKIYTSETTTIAVEEILNNNDSSLTTYENSMKMHLRLYNYILKFLNTNTNKTYDYYPFT